MKTKHLLHFLPTVLLFTLLTTFATLPARAQALDIDERKAILRLLDLDGDFLSFTSVQKAVADGLGFFGPMMEMDEEARQEIPEFLQQTGLEEVTAVAHSHTTLENGRNLLRMVVGKSASATAPFWEVLPQGPNRLTGLQRLPKSTAWCLHGDVDPGKLIEVLANASDEGPDAFRESIDRTLPLSRIANAIDGDWGLAITMHPERTQPLPMLENPFPELGALFVCTAKDESLATVITEALSDILGPPQVAEKNGFTITRFPAVDDLPLPIRPHLVQNTDGFLGVTTSSSLAKHLLAGGESIIKAPAFRGFFTPEIADANVIHFLSPRLHEALEKDPAYDEILGDLLSELHLGDASSFLPERGHLSGLLSVTHQSEGWRIGTLANGPVSSMASAVIAPIAAAILLPTSDESFTEGKLAAGLPDASAVEPTDVSTIQPTTEPAFAAVIAPPVQPSREPLVESDIEPSVEPAIESSVQQTAEHTVESTAGSTHSIADMFSEPSRPILPPPVRSPDVEVLEDISSPSSKGLSDAQKRALAKMGTSGRDLYSATLNDARGNRVVGFPKFQGSSTEYFNDLLGKGDFNNAVDIVKSGAEVFAGADSLVGTSLPLKSENVGWCVILQQSGDTPAGTPFMFSSNLKVGSNGSLSVNPTDAYGEAVVVVYHGNTAVVHESVRDSALVDAFKTIAPGQVLAPGK